MTPHKQLFRHSPDEGQIGDCWRTCFACLLDMQPAQVPHFVDGSWEDSVRANARAREWLAQRGLSFVEHAYSATLEEVLGCGAVCGPGTHYILSGNSISGVGHSVICLDNRIVWDPHPCDVGIVGPMRDGYYWITWLVPSFLVAPKAQEREALRA